MRGQSLNRHLKWCSHQGKSEQIQQKKVVKNELKDIIKKLGALNNALEKTQDEVTLNGTLEAREAFQSKYQNYFRTEAERPPCSDT